MARKRNGGSTKYSARVSSGIVADKNPYIPNPMGRYGNDVPGPRDPYEDYEKAKRGINGSVADKIRRQALEAGIDVTKPRKEQTGNKVMSKKGNKGKPTASTPKPIEHHPWDERPKRKPSISEEFETKGKYTQGQGGKRSQEEIKQQMQRLYDEQKKQTRAVLKESKPYLQRRGADAIKEQSDRVSQVASGTSAVSAVSNHEKRYRDLRSAFGMVEG